MIPGEDKKDEKLCKQTDSEIYGIGSPSEQQLYITIIVNYCLFFCLFSRSLQIRQINKQKLTEKNNNNATK